MPSAGKTSRLAEGVKVLAAKSSDLAQEIRDNRPMTPNMIFEQLSTNRVLANFTGVKPGLFGGDSSKDKQAQTYPCHRRDQHLRALPRPGHAADALESGHAMGAS